MEGRFGKRTPVREESGKYYVGEILSTGFIPGSYLFVGL